MCGCGIGGEEGFEECEGMNTLPYTRLNEARDDAMCLEPVFRSGSEAHFAEDYQLSERLLGMIIGRGYAWDAQKCEEVFLLSADEVGSQGFGRPETKGLFTGGLEFSEEAFLDLLG